jgi:hypothetical protein
MDTPIAKLTQDFTGTYHVTVNGRIEAMSLTLAQAIALAARNGWTLR